MQIVKMWVVSQTLLNLIQFLTFYMIFYFLRQSHFIDRQQKKSLSNNSMQYDVQTLNFFSEKIHYSCAPMQRNNNNAITKVVPWLLLFKSSGSLCKLIQLIFIFLGEGRSSRWGRERWADKITLLDFHWE